MRAKFINFERTGDSKRALKLGEGLLVKLRELMDADDLDVIKTVDRDDGSLLLIEGAAPGFVDNLKNPKVYINRLIKELGLDQYIKFRRTYIPYKVYSTHNHYYNILPEYDKDFPNTFRISLYGTDHFEW